MTPRLVKVADLVQGCPPAILISETVTGPGGCPRLFTQKIQVLDDDLWKRLTLEVEKGNSIRVTVKTVWPDEGRYYTVLVSFTSQEAHPFASSPAGLLEAAGSSS